MRIAIACALLLSACTSQAPAPAELAFGSESCSFCRMVISDRRFPSQIVSSAHDPQFFDDLDCLRRHLETHPLPEGAVVFVTDYKDSTWIPAHDANFFRCGGMSTPMNSGLIASSKTGTTTFCPPIEAREIVK